MSKASPNPRKAAQAYWKYWCEEFCNEALNTNASPKAGYVYFLKTGSFYKIGKTKRPLRRFPQIRIEMPLPTYLWSIWWSPDMTALESMLHSFYAQYRTNGEWFALPEKEALAIKYAEGPFFATFFPEHFSALDSAQYGQIVPVLEMIRQQWRDLANA